LNKQFIVFLPQTKKAITYFVIFLRVNTANHTAIVKHKATQCGLDYCGIARAVPLEDDVRLL